MEESMSDNLDDSSEDFLNETQEATVDLPIAINSTVNI